MKVLLIQAVYLAGSLSIGIHASDVASRQPLAAPPGEESGVMAHGTVFEIKNEEVVVLSPDSREHIRFSHGEGTIYVDGSGNPISLKVVKSGVSVTIFYTIVKDQRIANRVIVGESPPVSKTPELGAERLLLKTDNEKQPLNT